MLSMAHRFTAYEPNQLAALTDALKDGDIQILNKEIENQAKHRNRSNIINDVMIIACEHGFPHAVKFFLTHEQDALRYRTKERAPLLHLAVRAASQALKSLKSQPTVGQRLNGLEDAPHRLNNPPAENIDAKLVPQTNALHVVRLLLDDEVDMKAYDQDGKTALMYARHIKVVQLLLGNLAQVDVDELLSQRDREGNDALLISLIDDPDCEISHFLIDHQADLATKDRRHRTALIAAAWTNKLSVIDRLLRIEGISEMRDDDKRTIWHHLAQDNKMVWGEELVDKLLDGDNSRETSLNSRDGRGRTCLHLIATIGNEMLARKLFAKRLFSSKTIGAVEPRHNKTALHFAAAYNRTEVVELLLTNGAKADTICAGGWTALHMACGNDVDCKEIVKLLLADPAYGTDVNTKLDNGQTALHIAAAYGQAAVVDSLLSAGAAVDAKELGGFTPMHVACGTRAPWSKLPDASEGEEEADGDEVNSEPLRVVRLLLQHGAKLNSKSDAGKTPLHVAAESGDSELVEFLLDQPDIQWSTQDKYGISPLLGASIAKSKVSKENAASVEAVIKLLAPWDDRQTKALPENVLKAVKEFNATVVRFDERERLYRVPLYDLLYKEPGERGRIDNAAVSTRCRRPAKPEDQSTTKGGAGSSSKRKRKGLADLAVGEKLRWIHLPANNTAWCRTLLTKRFIEDGCNDISGFKDMERALNNQGHGSASHSHYIHAGAQSLSHLDSNAFPFFASNSRSDSLEVIYHNAGHVWTTDLVRRDSDMPAGVFGDGATHKRPGLPLSHQSAPADSQTTRARVDQEADPRPSIKRAKELKSDGSLPVAGNMFVSVPYLDFELFESQQSMRQAVDATLNGTTAPLVAALTPRDELLIQAYPSTSSRSLHIRRTLDQFYYRSIDTQKRDRDQVVYRYLKNSNEPKMLMVDQLWLWIIDDLVVTSFPQPWGESEFSGVLGCILEDIYSVSEQKIENAYDLADCVIRHALSACDHHSLPRGMDRFADMFESSIGKTLDDEIVLYDNFDEASKLMFLELGQNTEKPDQNVKNVAANEKPAFTDRHLDISGETNLLREVKDISDELGIILKLFEVQARVLQEIDKTYESIEQLHNPKVLGKARQSISDQARSKDHAIKEIQGMAKQAHHIYENTKDLLNLEQTRAQSIEAWFARSRDESMAQQGQTIMVFTIVTIIFLPLSFIAAFFAIDITDLPHTDPGQQEMSLSYVAKYIFGIGFPFAIACILIGFHQYILKAIRYMKKLVTSVPRRISEKNYSKAGPATLPKYEKEA